MSYIKNIIKIEVAKAKELRAISFPAKELVIVPNDVEFRQIPCKSTSSCEITDKVESKVRIFTSKLTFKSSEQIDGGGQPLAYRVTTADGCQYLIGFTHRPFPVLTRTENMPSSMTDSSLITYTVTWTDVVKPLQIVERVFLF